MHVGKHLINHYINIHRMIKSRYTTILIILLAFIFITYWDFFYYYFIYWDFLLFHRDSGLGINLFVKFTLHFLSIIIPIACVTNWILFYLNRKRKLYFDFKSIYKVFWGICLFTLTGLIIWFCVTFLYGLTYSYLIGNLSISYIYQKIAEQFVINLILAGLVFLTGFAFLLLWRLSLRLVFKGLKEYNSNLEINNSSALENPKIKPNTIFSLISLSTISMFLIILSGYNYLEYYDSVEKDKKNITKYSNNVLVYEKLVESNKIEENEIKIDKDGKTIRKKVKEIQFSNNLIDKKVITYYENEPSREQNYRYGVEHGLQKEDDYIRNYWYGFRHGKQYRKSYGDEEYQELYEYNYGINIEINTYYYIYFIVTIITLIYFFTYYQKYISKTQLIFTCFILLFIAYHQEFPLKKIEKKAEKITSALMPEEKKSKEKTFENKVTENGSNDSNEETNKVITEPKKLLALIKNNAVTVDFHGFGTEPFWDLYVLKDELLYSDEGNEVFESYILLDRFQEGEYYQVLRCQKISGEIHSLTLTNKPTDNGMSEELYPFEVILDYGDSKRYGCGWSSNPSVETYPPQPPLEVEIFEDIEPPITGSDVINYNEFFIFNVKAVKNEKDAIQEKNALKELGHPADYLWIPDYNSLSGADYFSVYIGPYSTQLECENSIDQLKIDFPKGYGLLVSQENKRVQINGKGKVKVTEPNK